MKHPYAENANLIKWGVHTLGMDDWTAYENYESARAKLAQVMLRHKLPQLGPLLARLNAEMARFEAEDSAMAMARQVAGTAPQPETISQF